MDLTEEICSLCDEDVWKAFSLCKIELKKRELVRTNNITGERGEFLAINTYNNTPGLPTLQAAPKSTRNVDALSKNGERYSIKTITVPGKATGVFYGMGDKETEFTKMDKKFEYLIVVMIDKNLEPVRILELDWKIFIKHLKWQSRMRAWYIYVTESLINDSRSIYRKKIQTKQIQTVRG